MLETDKGLADNRLVMGKNSRRRWKERDCLKREKRGFCERIGYIGQGIEPDQLLLAVVVWLNRISTGSTQCFW